MLLFLLKTTGRHRECILNLRSNSALNLTSCSYFDREEVGIPGTLHFNMCSLVLQNVGYEVRAGLSSVYETDGWVASDIHSEAASRTLDYACMTCSLIFSKFILLT